MWIGLEPRESGVTPVTPLPPPLCPAPGPCRPHLRSVLSPRAPEAGHDAAGPGGAVLPVMVLAAPPPINKLALFPDKSRPGEAKNITQIVGHSGCEAEVHPEQVGSRGRWLGGVRRPRARKRRAARAWCRRSDADSGLLSQGLPGTVLQLQSLTPSRSRRSPWCTVIPACRPSPCGRSRSTACLARPPSSLGLRVRGRCWGHARSLPPGVRTSDDSTCRKRALLKLASDISCLLKCSRRRPTVRE